MSILFAARLCPAQASDSIRPATLAQLQQFLSAATHGDDGDLAKQISLMELTERVSPARLPELEKQCPGNECRYWLMALVDRSEFLETDANQPAGAAPKQAEQKEIVGRFIDFLKRMNHQMPNFIATRDELRMQDWPKLLQIGKEVAARTMPLQYSSETRSTLTYRDGKEEVENTKTKRRGYKKPELGGLSTWGLFGPILGVVIVDASKSTFDWSHWEQSGDTRIAVFRFSIPKDKSNYDVQYCCVPNFVAIPPKTAKAITPNPVDIAPPITVTGTAVQESGLERLTAYHGELAVNASDGTIQRIVLIADLDKGDAGATIPDTATDRPLKVADLAVEYGPVDIGGKQYICPVNAVALSRAQTWNISRSAHVVSGVHAEQISGVTIDETATLGPVRTYLDHISFREYRVFRSESRILPGFSEP